MANTGGRRDDWRTSAAGHTTRPGAKGKGGKVVRRVALAAVLVAFLVGLLISWPLFVHKPREPVCFAVPITEYLKTRDSRWPPNPWAEADAHGLRDRFEGDSAQAFQHQEKGAFTRELANAVRQADAENRSLVVYVTALGTAADDVPYLLPSDARHDDPASWLTLDDVLTPLRAGGRTDRLLILDVRPVRSPRAALPTGDVNELLDAALSGLHDKNDLPLLVFTANTPATGPVSLPTVRHTVFGLALERGLLGGADGWVPNTAKNTEVTARELIAYARECTHAATGGAQRPQVYGYGPDFFLRGIPPGPPPEAEAQRLKYPDFLAKAWEDVENARAAGLPARAPRAMRMQTDAAVDAERWWRAGASESALAQFNSTFTAFRGELTGPALAPPRPPVASVARAALDPKFDGQKQAAATALQGLLDLLRSGTYETARKGDTAKADEMVNAAAGKLVIPPEVPFTAVAAVVWAAAADKPQLPFIRTLVGVINDKVKEPPPLAEWAALNLLTLLPDGRDPRAMADAVTAWLTVTAEAEAAVLFDARGLPQVRAKLEEAENLYHTEAVALVEPDARPDQFARVAKRLLAVREKYVAVREAAAAVGAAWRQVEDARAALADLADRYPDEFTRLTSDKRCSLAELTDAFSTVVERLRAESVPDLDQLKRETAALQTALKTVRDPLKLPTAAVPESALDWPGWTLRERQRVFDRLQDDVGGVLGRWPLTAAKGELAAPEKLGRKVFDDSVHTLRNRADLIRVWDPVQARRVKADLSRPGELPAKRLSELAKEVGGQLRIESRKRFLADEPGRPFLGWVVPPEDTAVPPHELRALPAQTPELTNPEAVTRQKAEVALGAWVATARYSRLSRELLEPKAGDSYSAVARRYKAVAGVFP